MPVLAVTDESTEVLRNPDRGFYKLLQLELSKEKNNIEFFKDELGDTIENDEDVAIISFQLNLKQYVTGNTVLPKAKIDEINEYFSIMRKHGYQVIFRVVYDSEGEANPEPEFNQLLNHIEQMKTIYEKNEDILLLVEAGYLGSYGEWHNGKYDEDVNYKNQVIKKLLDCTPKSVHINLRTPSFINDYMGDTQTVNASNAYTNADIARLGLHNDGYLGSITDVGTFQTKDRETSLAWQAKHTEYTIFGGECIRKNSQYNEFENAIVDMKLRHCTYLNKTYDRDVKNKWKNAKYNGEDTVYAGMDGYTYIQNHLGYRLVLQEANVQNTNGKLNVDLKIKNVGFGNIIKPKKVEIILQNGNNTNYIETNIDIRKCLNNNVYTIDVNKEILSNLANGEYKVYLNIREPFDSLKDNKHYRIKLANKNIWDETVGANYIGQINVGPSSVEQPNTNKPTVEQPNTDESSTNLPNIDEEDSEKNKGIEIRKNISNIRYGNWNIIFNSRSKWTEPKNNFSTKKKNTLKVFFLCSKIMPSPNKMFFVSVPKNLLFQKTSSKNSTSRIYIIYTK